MDNKKLIEEMVHKTICDTCKAFTNPEKVELSSAKLKEVSDTLCKKIFEVTVPIPKTFFARIKFFFKDFHKGVIMYFIQYAYNSFMMWCGFKLVFPIQYWTCFGIFMILRTFKMGVIDLKTQEHRKNG